MFLEKKKFQLDFEVYLLCGKNLVKLLKSGPTVPIMIFLLLWCHFFEYPKIVHTLKMYSIEAKRLCKSANPTNWLIMACVLFVMLFSRSSKNTSQVSGLLDTSVCTLNHIVNLWLFSCYTNLEQLEILKVLTVMCCAVLFRVFCCSAVFFCV